MTDIDGQWTSHDIRHHVSDSDCPCCAVVTVSIVLVTASIILFVCLHAHHPHCRHLFASCPLSFLPRVHHPFVSIILIAACRGRVFIILISACPLFSLQCARYPNHQPNFTFKIKFTCHLYSRSHTRRARDHHPRHPRCYMPIILVALRADVPINLLAACPKSSLSRVHHLLCRRIPPSPP